MNINVRRNVFETNSSTNHTYTFSIHSKQGKKEKNAIYLSSFNEKAALIEWLFKESYYREGSLYFDGLILDNEMLLPKKSLDKAFLSQLCSLLKVEEDMDIQELYEIIKDLIMEETFQEDIQRKINEVSFTKEGNLKINLTEKQRESFLYKSALLVLCDIGTKEELIFFNHLLRNEFTEEDYIQFILLEGQILSIDKLHSLSIEILEKMSGKRIDEILQEVGYIGFDGLLDDFYDFAVFSEQLKLNLHSYEGFKDSLIQFLEDDNTIIQAI